MLAIKFQRIGKKRQASFRIVVAEKRSKLQGRVTEDIGWFNPHTDKYVVDKERAAHWMKVGAQPTDTAWNLLVRSGVVKGKKVAVHSKKKVSEKDAQAAAAAAVPAAPAAPAASAEAAA